MKNYYLPDKKKYDDGRLTTYYFKRVFAIGKTYYEPGEIYHPYQYTYEDLIWRIREEIITPVKLELMDNGLTRDDVRAVASSINKEVTPQEIGQILSEYSEAQEDDPSGEWYLVVEQQIYEKIQDRENQEESR